MKTGARITVKFIRPEGDAVETATVCRTTKEMLPLPDGYLPVRLDSDGARVLVHESRVIPAPSAAFVRSLRVKGWADYKHRLSSMGVIASPQCDVPQVWQEAFLKAFR